MWCVVAFQSAWLSVNQCSQICSHGHRNKKKEPITGHHTLFNRLYHVPWTSKASGEGGWATEDDQGLSCVRAGSFCELISLRVAHSSQITQHDGGIQMTQFIMITMMVVSQQGLGLMNQAQIPVWGCCSSWSLAPWPCSFILLPWFGIIGPGLILHCPPSLQDIDLSLDLVVWWYKGEHMPKYTQFIQ